MENSLDKALKTIATLALCVIANRGLDKDQEAISDLDWAIGLKNNSLEFCLPY